MISTIYQRSVGGAILRVIQVLWGGFFTEDGGYMAQHVIAEFADVVLEADEDYADAVAWVREVEAEDYLAQFE